jgi:hypothetical protein
MNMEMEKVHSNHIFLESEDKLLSSSRSNLGKEETIVQLTFQLYFVFLCVYTRLI